LQVFNRYLVAGGEEMAVREYARILATEGRFGECIFDSADWSGAMAPPAWKQAAWTFYNPASVRSLREKQEHIQARAWIVHNVLPVGSAGVYREALRQKIPLIQLIHNFRPFSVTGYGWVGRQLNAAGWPGNYLREIAHGAWQGSRLKTAFLACVLTSMHLRNQFQAVKSWIAISDFMRRQFIAAGVSQERVFRLYHSWNVKNTGANFPEEDYYLFLGRIMEAKGIKVLADAWDILARQSGARCPRLVIAGAGPLEDWVKAAQARNPRIEFRGYVTGEEKQRLLADCRAIVQPAIWAEPLSLVLYEAYDYGKPVLAAASGGMPELVSPETGLVHTPGIAEELAAQVRQMEGFSLLQRQSMGQAGRRWLLQNTNEATWKKQFFAIVDHSLSPTS
jgi:glycosyltransferase involved in cell wall biosynthesis